MKLHKSKITRNVFINSDKRSYSPLSKFIQKYNKTGLFLLLILLTPLFSFLAYHSVNIVMGAGLPPKIIKPTYIIFYSLSYSFIFAPFVFFSEKVKNIGIFIFMTVSLYGTILHIPDYVDLPIKYMDIENYRSNHITSIMV